MKWLRMGSAALAIVAFSACDSLDGLTDLEVTNQNAADRARVLQTWGDNENFVLGSFNALWSAMANGYPAQALGTMADEITVSWGNYDGRVLSSEPRSPFNNSPSYRFNNHAETPWYNSYEALSNVYDGLRAINEDETGQACVESDCDRLFAYGKFVQGYAHMWLALFFDSAFVLDETIELFDEAGDAVDQPFVDYMTMANAAIGYFDEAIATATGGTWTIGDGIFGGAGNRFDGNDMAMLSNSFKAFLYPQVARTAAERDGLNWANIATWAQAGMPGDVLLEGDGCDQWCYDYLYFSHITTSTTWNRADYKTIGQYDENSVAGNGVYGYVDWLNEATAARTEFLMIGHPDNRIVGAGDTDGTTNGTDFKFRGPSRFPSSRGTYHYSFYSPSTFESYPPAESGPMPWILRSYIDLTLAEAQLRTGGMTQGIADLINNSRVTRGGLPALTAATPATVAMDAIIYERRIEGFATCSGCAYFNRRGEGGLANTQGYTGNDPAGKPGGFDKDGNAIQHHQGMVEGTPLHMAPPGKELEVLERRIWTYGGVGSEMAAGQGLGAPPVLDLAAFGKGSPEAFYISVEESLQRREDRRNRSKSLVRYVQ